MQYWLPTRSVSVHTVSPWVSLRHHGANLYSTHVWFAHVMPSFSCVEFVLFCFRFRLFFAFTETAVLRSMVFRSLICMRSDSHTQLPANCLRHFFVFVSSFFVFCLDDVVFTEYSGTITVSSLYGEYVVPFPFSGRCFSTLKPRAGFLT